MRKRDNRLSAVFILSIVVQCIGCSRMPGTEEVKSYNVCEMVGLKYSDQECKQRVDKARSRYIVKTIDQLKEFKPTGVENHHVEDLRGRYLHHCGFVPVGVDGWVYCIGHSFHDNKDGEIPIGDVNLAIDNEGNIYINRGHLCEGPAFWSPSKDGLPSMKEFFVPASADKGDKWEHYVADEVMVNDNASERKKERITSP